MHTETTIGDGIQAAPALPVVHDEQASVEEPTDLAQQVKNLVHGELSNVLTDVEFRLAQTADINRRTLAALERIGGQAPDLTADGGKVYAEDLDLLTHQITGYTVTSNSPTAGSIAWAAVNIVYNGTNYAVANGNSALKYVWFDAAVSATVLQASNTKPTLAGNACLLFFNDGGVVREVLNASIPPVVGNSSVDTSAIQTGAVGTGQIAQGAVTAEKTTFYASLAEAVTAAQTAADLAQATADGSITSYFQSAAPWANGSVQDVSKVGDVWYDQDDGHSYRWSGASGTPANTWVEIVNTEIAAALAAANAAQAKANIKTTTYYSVAASPPTAPTPPAGSGFTTGDFWVVTDQGNLTRRWSGTAWVDLTIGTAAIANSAITDAKVASNISGAKLTGGSVGATQIGSGAITPVKLNVLQHVLY